MFGILMLLDGVFGVILWILWAEIGIFLFIFDCLWDGYDIVSGWLSVGWVFIDEYEFITLYDEISFFKLGGFVIGCNENMLKKVFELYL